MEDDRDFIMLKLTHDRSKIKKKFKQITQYPIPEEVILQGPS